MAPTEGWPGFRGARNRRGAVRQTSREAAGPRWAASPTRLGGIDPPDDPRRAISGPQGRMAERPQAAT